MTTIGRLRELREQGLTLDEALTYSAADHLRERITTLENQLRWHGRHTDDCDTHTTYTVTPQNPVPHRGDCDCDWEKIEKELM